MEFLPLILLIGIVVGYFYFKKKPVDRVNFPKEHPITNENVIPEEEDVDAWEGSFWESENPFPVHAVLKIRYLDGKTHLTERVITVRQFDTDYLGGLLIAHCHLRNGTRTFRTNRIKECVDVDTGEIITDLKNYLRKKYESSPDFSADKLLETDYDTLRVLLYVAKADGSFRKAEKQIFLDVCQKISSDSRLTESILDALLNDIENMSVNAFKQAVGRLSKQSHETQKIVFEATERMIGTQKAVHAVEQEALDYIKKRFAIS